jgi:hypothetical protein
VLFLRKEIKYPKPVKKRIFKFSSKSSCWFFVKGEEYFHIDSIYNIILQIATVKSLLTQTVCVCVCDNVFPNEIQVPYVKD